MRHRGSLLLGSLFGGMMLAGCFYIDLYAGTNIIETTGTGGATSGTTTGGAGGASLCAPGSAQPCYDGPAGTEGQGICKAGTQACAADGASWGPCTGEVVPQIEDCATPIDEDCDGQAPACKGSLLWAERFGDAGEQLPFGLATDGTGNVVVTGRFSGTVDFGGGPLTSAGGHDVFVVKLDPDGHHVWSRRFGDASDQQATAIAIDAQGGIFITGTFSGTVDFGGGALLADSQDVFVAKLGADGAPMWSKRFGGPSDETAIAVAVDATSGVFVTGVFGDTTDFGGGPLVSAGGADVFVVKMSAADGGHMWSARFGDADQQVATGIAVGADGDVVLTGGFAGSIDFGGGALISTGTSDLFVARLTTDGAHQWSARYGDAGDLLAGGVAVGSAGEILLTGYFTGAVLFGPQQLENAGDGDIFVAKLDAGGAVTWARSFGGTGDEAGASVATDAGGNILLTGYIGGTVDFGGGPLPSEGGTDAFLLKLDASGAHVWSERFGDSHNQAGTSVKADPGGNVLVTGYMSGTTDFGGGPLVSAGGTDIFIAKFSP